MRFEDTVLGTMMNHVLILALMGATAGIALAWTTYAIYLFVEWVRKQ